MIANPASYGQCQGLPPTCPVARLPLDHSYSGLWVPKQLTMVKQILGKQLSRWPHVSRMLSYPSITFFSQGIVSQINLYFSSLWTLIGGVSLTWDYSEVSSKNICYCPNEKYLVSL
jgi:hypothetical protein